MVNRSQSHSGDGPESSRSLQFDYDDQDTLLESTPSAGDNVSVFSGTSTIGDYARLGFVNRCPQFTTDRKVILASVVLSKGFFAWKDEKSFQSFIENKRKLDRCLEQGTGWPLFHCISVGFKSYFNKNVPVNRIFKYQVVENDREGEIKQPNKELLHRGEKRSLYKVEYCDIFRNVDNKNEVIEHKFVIYRKDGSQYAIRMVNHVARRHTDFQILEPTSGTVLNARWLGTSGYASVFGSNDFKLVVLDDGIPHLMTHDNQEIHDYAEYSARNGTRMMSRMPVWAIYSRSKALISIPKRRVIKMATFQIAEVDNSTEMPFISEVLTCMCMYLHELEARKERRQPIQPTLGLSLIEFM